MKELTEKLASEFTDKEYAHAYLDDFTNMEIAAQIKALREQRGWTQKELAEHANMKQTRVSRLEDIDYDSWTIKTLRKLAYAFDLGLKVSFEKFSNRIDDVQKISKSSLERVSREADLCEFVSRKYPDKTVSNVPDVVTNIFLAPERTAAPDPSGNWTIPILSAQPQARYTAR